MTPIQIILIAVSIVLLVIYINRLRTRLLDRLIFFIFAALAIVLVVQPDWANDVAHYFGVGRGADLLVYVGFSTLAFLWLGLYSRQRDLDRRLTELARKMTLLGAERPGKRKAKSS
ncbi:MAG: DUF2304 domain-containing protein [Anaerolineales bacterium]